MKSNLNQDKFALILHISANARLRGWQRITLNSNTTAETTEAHWDWKRHALTVPLEAFVIGILSAYSNHYLQSGNTLFL
ncbi:hypothetical protein DN31_3944 [Vibrio mimicus]|nr:hypothetical protein DN31_3944 [Vibrio mimicus]